MSGIKRKIMLWAEFKKGKDSLENPKKHPVKNENIKENLDEMSAEAKEYISKKIEKLVGEGRPQKQAVAMAYSYAKRKGYKVDESSNATVDVMSLNSLQFYKLIDLLEADIEAYGQEDIQYYEELYWIFTQDTDLTCTEEKKPTN